jgi:hypothetical protein
MRVRELFHAGNKRIFVALTNEEARFLKKHSTKLIDLESLAPRESRIAENLIFKDVLCKINHKEAMVHENVYFK